jgi:hypothetical protein
LQSTPEQESSGFPLKLRGDSGMILSSRSVAFLSCRSSVFHGICEAPCFQ